MFRLVTFLTMLAPFVGTGQTFAALVHWQIADGGNGHYYEFVDGNFYWPEAKTAAEASSVAGVSGHLVTIGSQAESDFIRDNLYTWPGYPTPWIGLTDSEAYGGSESFGQPNPEVDGWVWVTGEPVVFTNWRTGEPNNFDNDDFALIFNQGGEYGWNDHWDAYSGGYIVEYPAPEPSSLLLWSIGVAGFGVWAWRRRLFAPGGVKGG